jgi:hypothetical protein
MLILAIDPGPTHSGVCIFDNIRCMPTAFGWLPNAEVLDRIRHARKLEITHFAAERMKSRGNPVAQVAFDTAEFVGRCFQRAEDCGLIVGGVFNEEVRIHVCGKAGVNVSNIRRALVDRFGGDAATKKSKKCSRKQHVNCPKCDGSGRIGTDGVLVQMVGDHTVSALGVAVTFGDQNQPIPF